MKRNASWGDKDDLKAKSSPIVVLSNNIDVNPSPEKHRKRSFFIEHFKDYTSKTSLHGFQYFGEDKRSIFEKLWWGFMVSLSFSTCAYLIYKVWLKWDQNPVIVSFSESPMPIWKIPFPAVTICPTMQVNHQLYNFLEMKSNVSNRDDLFRLNAVALLCERTQRTGYEFLNESAVNELLKVTPTQEDIMFFCEFINSQGSCDKFFTPILTDFGSCFNYNMLDSKDIFKSDVININYSTNAKKNEGWSLDAGYEENLPINTYPSRGLSTGIQTSFHILFKKSSDMNDYSCSGMIDGFKVSFHAPNIIPRTTDQFFWVPMNMISIIGIKPKMVTTSDGLKDYHPSRRQCFFSNERSLRYFQEYTQENCELECLTNLTLHACGCVTYAMPRVNGTRICGDAMKICVKSISVNKFQLGILTQESGSAKIKAAKKIEKQCNCLPSCSSLTYEPVTSVNTVEWKSLIKSLNKDADSSEHYAFLRMYFQESQFIPSKRSELYGLVDFLSNCGGLLGLCLGFSVLSLVEIVYFITLRLFCHIRRKHKKQKIHNENSESN